MAQSFGRTCLLAGTAAAGLMAAPAAWAQTAASGAVPAPAIPAAATARSAAAPDDDPQEIVVTGSRIARPEFAAPNPIVSFNAASIEQSGNTNLTNFLERVPALSGSRDFTQTSGGNAVYSNPFGAAGLNELNLRGLGVSRTLVLVNGRRHVAGEPGSAAVDINSIPTDLIERVDVLTGGASAVYGADGVSGVVNFVLKRDFEGLSARTQLGLSSRGDAANRFASIAAGRNFAGGRGNITLAYEYDADERLRNDDRGYLQRDRRKYLIPNDADVGDDPKIPDNILVGDLRYPGESFIGAVDVNGDGYADYNGLGQPYRHGAPAAYYSTGGDDSPVAGFYSGDLAPRIRRHDANLLGHFDMSDALKLSVEAKYAQTRATSFDYYTGTYGTSISIDNPTVPASIRDAAIAAGQDAVTVTRDNGDDYGRHGEDDLRRTYRAVLDASGRLSGHATWDAYYEYGRTDERITKLNDRLADRFQAALDVVTDPATGQLTCRSNLDPSAAAGAVTFAPGPNSGCVPVSLFGADQVSNQALSFVRVDDTSHARLTQQVASASVSGDFGALFSLPGGPVQFSLGGEYRRETSRFSPSDNLTQARFFQYDEPALVVGAAGRFNVKEGFAELNAPILSHAAFAETLSLGAAYRRSHYSTIGGTDTWQVNGVYAPVRDLSVRGSYGKSVRAPNIGELFQPATGTANFFTDPCSPAQLNNGTQYRTGNCATLLAGLGATIDDGLQTGSNIFGVASGNRDLKAERARTWTAGMVLRPRWLPGFTASVDWYDIDLKGAITTPAPQQLAELCVDEPTIANQFCAAVTREQGTGRIISYTIQPQNVSRFRTAGADLDVDYVIRTPRAGTIDLRFVGGYLDRLDFVGIPGAQATDSVDQAGSPRWTANFSPSWTIGKVALNYNLRWLDRTRTQSRLVTEGDPDYAPAAQLRYKALWQHDVQVQVALESGLSVYAGGQNLSDQKPDPGNSINEPISAVGRTLYVGAKLNLGRR